MQLGTKGVAAVGDGSALAGAVRAAPEGDGRVRGSGAFA